MDEHNYYYTYGDFLADIGQRADSNEPQPHQVTDMRSRDSGRGGKRHDGRQTEGNGRRGAEHGGRGKGKRRKWRAAVAVTAVLLAALSALLLAADLLTPKGVTGYVMAVFSPEPQAVWGVCSGSFDTLGEARTASDGVRTAGGAGFVAYDGRYNVLLAAYPTQQEAQTVADKHGYTLYTLRTEGMEASDLPIAYRSAVKPLIGYHTALYAKLYEMSAQLAEGGTNVPYCKQRLVAIHDALQGEADAFLAAADSATDAATCNFRSALLATVAALEYLQRSDEHLFLSDLRWTYIMVLRINRL